MIIVLVKTSLPSQPTWQIRITKGCILENVSLFLCRIV
jgi:hypothetical protein